jgi:hypothetical protein
MTTINSTKFIEHPLENFFDIEPNTTIVEYKELVPTEIPEAPGYDEKDQDIESQLQTIYDSAMASVETLTDEIGIVEGKYKARMGEVSATMLSVALNAVNARAHLKMHKDKLTPTRAVPTGPQNITNNLNVMTDRNDIIRLLHSVK